MLDQNPKTRISINECLEHAFFKPEKKEMIEADFGANIEESSILNEIHLKHLYISFAFFNFSVGGQLFFELFFLFSLLLF